LGEYAMARNAPAGDGHRNGAVRKRSQIKTKVTGEEHFTKRSKATSQFTDQKKDDRSSRAYARSTDHSEAI
jgi:hypothetical protein